MVAPVVAVGVDVVAAEDVVLVFADDGDGVAGHEDQYWGVEPVGEAVGAASRPCDDPVADGSRVAGGAS